MKLLAIDTGLANIGCWFYDTETKEEVGVYISTSAKNKLETRLRQIYEILSPLIDKADFILFEHFIPRTSGITKVGATIEVNGLIQGLLFEKNKSFQRVYPHIWKPRRKKIKKEKKDLSRKNTHLEDARDILYLKLEGLI